MSSLQKNIKSIEKIAEDCHIKIQTPKSMNLVKIKHEKSNFSYDVTELKFQPINVNNFVKLPRESSSLDGPSTSSNYKQAVEAMEITEESKVQAEQVEENIKTATSFKPAVVDVEMEPSSHEYSERQQDSLRGAGDYKYGYEDIITGTFEEKLNKCLSGGITISMESLSHDTLNNTFYENYKTMIHSNTYSKMKSFRENLPTYKKSKELLEVINNNQVIVISGETGCGKSTQVI